MNVHATDHRKRKDQASRRMAVDLRGSVEREIHSGRTVTDSQKTAKNMRTDISSRFCTIDYEKSSSYLTGDIFIFHK